ncbi:leukocyte surface antigen CD53-like [Tribolium madens]|uniref:leukocyte surface antigen CD53-like n=1 Tax=Tribolium madens TaxID=41895 RepID=UPI001CF728D3|nr:leukocyte surface antigen CD53-like [Tribolium madens]
MASLRVKELLCLLYSALLFISGVLLIGFSVVLFYKVIHHFKFIPSSAIGPFIIYFLLGFVHLFVTWLGIKGPSREHDIHIILFMVITVILLVAECAVGVWSIILWDEVDVESLQLMQKSFSDLLNNDYDKKDWAQMESELKCCGYDGAKAYEKKNVLPLSCCNSDLQNSTCTQIYQMGCQKPLASYAKILLIDGAIMGFSCCVFQALGVFLFYTFLRALKAERAARAQRRLAMQRRVSQENGSANPTPSSPPPPTSA